MKNLKEFYSSARWLKFKIPKKTNKSCCYCCHTKAKGRLELHHVTYKRLGREKDTDVRWLCGNCHEQVHLLYISKPWQPNALEIATEKWKKIVRAKPPPPEKGLAKKDAIKRTKHEMVFQVAVVERPLSSSWRT